MPGPLHAPMLLVLLPFRFRDRLSGRWVKARYVADRSEIAAQMRYDRRWPRLCKNSEQNEVSAMSTSQNALYSICLGLEGFWYSRKRTEFAFLHSLIWTPPGLPS
jgi:hypothetical protein